MLEEASSLQIAMPSHKKSGGAKRELNLMDYSASALFPRDADSVAADYLAFLAERVPSDLVDQLDSDGQSEIGYSSKPVKAADLVRPLSTLAFPSNRLFDIACICGYISIIYGIRLEENQDNDEPHKMIYAASLYLYCFIRTGGCVHIGYLAAIRVMATVPIKLDVQSRLQIVRFLASLVPMYPSDTADETAGLSALLLALSLVIGSIVSDLGMLAEQTMSSEGLVQEWRELEASQGLRDNPYRLSQMLSDMYGPQGKVRQSADRFLLATRGEDGTDRNRSHPG